jgi:zinc protease
VKHRTITPALAAFAAVGAATFAAALQVDSPLAGARLFTLENGLKVIVREQNDAPLVALDLWIKAGSADEKPEERGAAHFVEHALFKGTEKRGTGEIDSAFEDIGSTLNAGTTRYATHFFATVASPYLSSSLEALADAVTSSSLKPDEIERERAVILDELARTGNDWRRALIDACWKASWGDSAHSRPVLGDSASLAAIKRDAIVSYYRTHYHPGNATLVLVGAIKPEAGRAAADEAFGSWKSTVAPRPGAAERSEAVVKDLQIESPSSDSVVAISVALPSTMTAAEYRAAEILAALLGDARSGRVAESVRKSLRQADCGAEYGRARGSGILVVFAKAPGRTTDLLAKGLHAELDRVVTDGIVAQDADWARRRVMGGHLFQAETYGGQARLLGQFDTLEIYESASLFMNSVQMVTAAQLNEFARKYLGKERRATVVMTPK